MTTWKDAIELYRTERDIAVQRKEIRDEREQELRDFFKYLSSEEWEVLSGMKPGEL